MTSWIVLLALAALFTLAVRRRGTDPRVPPGYDGRRQLDELRAMAGFASSRLF